ncbi:hypothetical protein KAR28_03190 [Candidatus Parcubacteria bacterium]|nr:hypothetical protein [Candidatus Parcubacteria bacterium]
MRNIFLLLLLTIIMSSGCAKQQNMDELADDSKYHYRNNELGFSVVFPKEFIYYQTQRKNHRDYVIMEYFVPTSDVDYPMDIPSYAKPVEIRIFTSENWDEILEEEIDGTEYQVLGKKDEQIYTIKFWERIPDDWTGRWNDEIKQGIIDSFVIR